MPVSPECRVQGNLVAGSFAVDFLRQLLRFYPMDSHLFLTGSPTYLRHGRVFPEIGAIGDK